MACCWTSAIAIPYSQCTGHTTGSQQQTFLQSSIKKTSTKSGLALRIYINYKDLANRLRIQQRQNSKFYTPPLLSASKLAWPGLTSRDGTLGHGLALDMWYGWCVRLLQQWAMRAWHFLVFLWAIVTVLLQRQAMTAP